MAENGEYDFILDGLKFSFSSLSTFENCPFAFKLTYIDYMERKDNFYGQYGNFIHSILEKYFKGKLDIFDLSDYYKDNYYLYITESPPPFQKNIAETYYNKGLEYFDGFYFNKDEYDILLIEESIEIDLDNIKFIVKPDLILHHKKTNKNILVDFKTANVYKNGKLDQSKIKSYMKQFLIYIYGIWIKKEIEIHEVDVWFVTTGTIEKFPVNPLDVQEIVDWVLETIEKIKTEVTFNYNNKNKFFCNWLCSVKDNCLFWEKNK